MKSSAFIVFAFLLAACSRGEQAPVATAPPSQGADNASYAFIERFPAGSINSTRHLRTPSGRGAFVMGLPYQGARISTLTVVQSFRYAYANVPVNTGDVLAFKAAKPFSVGKEVLGFIDVTDAGKTTRVFQKSLPPAPADDRPVWTSASVSLAKFAGHRVTVTFGADVIPGLSRTGGGIGAWVSFAQPGIVPRSKPH